MNRKIALITGAGSGIGRSTAIKFSKEGYNLIIIGRNFNKLAILKEKIERETKCEVYCLELDISNVNEVLKKISKIPENFQKINVLINNAGIALGLKKIHEIDLLESEKMIDVNLKGMINISRSIIPLMLSNNINGYIINIGSISAYSAYSGGNVYSATKAAVRNISDGMRIDLIDTNLRVTNIQPGLVMTNFAQKRLPDDLEKAESFFVGIEALKPEDVANFIFTVSELPLNVQIGEATLMCNKQGDSLTTWRN